jgi:hypothetical protein
MKNSVDLCTLIEQFGSENKCREYLEALRWLDTIMCPRCNSLKISKIVKHEFRLSKNVFILEDTIL